MFLVLKLEYFRMPELNAFFSTESVDIASRITQFTAVVLGHSSALTRLSCLFAAHLLGDSLFCLMGICTIDIMVPIRIYH